MDYCDKCGYIKPQCECEESKTNFYKITRSPEALAEYMCLHYWAMADYQKCVDWLQSEVEG